MSFEAKVKEFFSSFSGDVVEEHVIQYVTDEIEKGRRLSEILDDPYVKNRLTEERRESLALEREELIEAVEADIRATFERLEGGTAS